METDRLTYRQMMERFGFASTDAARMKAKREVAKGRWKLIPGNHPQDPVQVEIPLEDIPASPPERAAPTPPPSDPTPPDAPPAPAMDAMSLLAGELARALERGDQLVERLIAETGAHVETRLELALTSARVEKLTADIRAHREAKVEGEAHIARLEGALVAERKRTWIEKLLGI